MLFRWSFAVAQHPAKNHDPRTLLLLLLAARIVVATNMTDAAATAANRPVRQRKNVLHYSDDNPNTFTIKRRNGVIIDAPASVLASISTTTSATTASPSGGGGGAPSSAASASSSVAATTRPRSQMKQQQQQRQQSPATTNSSRLRPPNTISAEANLEDAATSSNASSSRRRGRPSSLSAPRNSNSAASVASSTTGSVGSATTGGRRGPSSQSAGAAATNASGKAATTVASAEAPASRPSVGTLSTAASSVSSSGAASRTGNHHHIHSNNKRRRRGSASLSRGSNEREPPHTASATNLDAGGHSVLAGRRRGTVAEPGSNNNNNHNSSSSKRRQASAPEAEAASHANKKPPPRRSSSLGSSGAVAAAASPGPNSRKRKVRPLSPGEKLSGMYGDGGAVEESDDEMMEGDGPALDRRGTVIDHQLFYQPLIDAAQVWNLGGGPAGGGGGVVKLVLQPPGLAYTASSGGGGAAPGQQSQSTSSSSLAGGGSATGGSSSSALASSLHRPTPMRVPTRLANHAELLKDPPVTCWSSRAVSAAAAPKDQAQTPQWAACGDAAGRVHLVALRPRTSIVASVETSASRRERHRAISSRRSATVAFPNTVLAAAWSATDSLVAVLTDTELECIDLLLQQDLQDSPTGADSGPNGTPTTQASSVVGRERAGSKIPYSIISAGDPPPVTSGSAAAGAAALSQPVLEWQGDRLLWVVGNGPSPTLDGWDGSTPPVAFIAERGSVPLRPIPVPCLAATWDVPSSEEGDRILALIREGKDSLALIRYDLSTSQTLQSVTLSLPGPVRRVHMQKHSVRVSAETGITTATLVTLCTPRGIHVHSAETLECLSIVGESVALHGKSVSWESCQLVPEPTIDGRRLNSNVATTNKGAQKQRSWWDLHSNDHAGDTPVPSYQLVAAPQPFKEPKELQSTLHIWRAPPSDAQSVQARFAFHLQHATTLPIPSSPGGVLGWTVTCDRIGGWSLLGVSAEFGSAFEWSSRLLSDFAGREYPVGYKLLSDNVEYLEDEDEMDQGMVYYEADNSSPSSPSSITPLFATPPRPPSSKHSKEIEQVLKLSVDDAPLQVLMTQAEAERCEMEVATCPPLVIQPVDRDRVSEATPEESNDVQGSATQREKIAPFLMCFPQYQQALEATKTHHDPTLVGDAASAGNHLSVPTEDEQEAAVVNANALLLKRGKKSRVASVETVLQASVVPDLRAHMSQLTSIWGDGSGSTCVAVAGGLTPTSSGTRSPVHANARASQHPRSESGDPMIEEPIEAETCGGMTTDHEMEVEREVHGTQVGQQESIQLEPQSSVEMEVEAPGLNSINDEKLPGTPLHGKVNELGIQIGNSPSEKASLGNDRLAQRQWNARELDRMSPSVAAKVSAEERELALELLLLSPGHQRHQPTNGSTECSTSPVKNDLERQEGQATASFVCVSESTDVNEESIVTPSETSPAILPEPGVPIEAPSPKGRSVAPIAFCAACRGRMVVHGCGKREKPVDYDAIERAERERKEREEEEKQQRRTEKRRAAEARRREARKKKKEEEDQKRLEEEERLRMLEAERLKQLEARHNRQFEVERHAHAQTSPTASQELLHENSASRDFTNWTQESFPPSFSPSKPHDDTRLEAHSATPTAHAFRLTESSVGPQEVFGQSGAANHADSALHSPNRTRDNVEDQHSLPTVTTDVRNGIDPPSAPTDVGRASHGFSHKTDASASNNTTYYEGPEGSVDEHAGLRETYDSHIEESAFASHNPPADRERIVEHHSVAQADVNAQDHSSMWSNVAAKPSTYATSAVLDVTKLEPSAPLSTADALEALAGLANSLPSVPTNVSHNFSSSGWSQSYEQVPSGREFSHHPQSHQYYEEQHRYMYQHTGPYASSTDGAARMGQHWDAAPSIFGQGSTGRAYDATGEHSIDASIAPPTQATAANTTGSSFAQSLGDYAPAPSK